MIKHCKVCDYKADYLDTWEGAEDDWAGHINQANHKPLELFVPVGGKPTLIIPEATDRLSQVRWKQQLTQYGARVQVMRNSIRIPRGGAVPWIELMMLIANKHMRTVHIYQEYKGDPNADQCSLSCKDSMVIDVHDCKCACGGQYHSKAVFEVYLRHFYGTVTVDTEFTYNELQCRRLTLIPE